MARVLDEWYREVCDTRGVLEVDEVDVVVVVVVVVAAAVVVIVVVVLLHLVKDAKCFKLNTG